MVTPPRGPILPLWNFSYSSLQICTPQRTWTLQKKKKKYFTYFDNKRRKVEVKNRFLCQNESWLIILIWVATSSLRDKINFPKPPKWLLMIVTWRYLLIHSGEVFHTKHPMTRGGEQSGTRITQYGPAWRKAKTRQHTHLGWCKGRLSK